jgi:hypothetical protein
MKLLILLSLTSCTFLPMYKVNKNEFCKQRSYDTVCEGRDNGPSYPSGYKSIYEE